jgi:hypothetical protein
MLSSIISIKKFPQKLYSDTCFPRIKIIKKLPKIDTFKHHLMILQRIHSWLEVVMGTINYFFPKKNNCRGGFKPLIGARTIQRLRQDTKSLLCIHFL